MDRENILALLRQKLRECAEKDVEALDDIHWGMHNGKAELLEDLIVEIENKSAGI